MINLESPPRHPRRAFQSMIPKSMSSTPIGDGYRFSEKIMRQEIYA